MSKLILITGATSGLGKDLVKKLLHDGYRVLATGRRLSVRSDIFADEKTKFGPKLYEHDLDVTSASERSGIVQIAQELGGVDILINNAGFGLFGPLEEIGESQVREQLEVNFIGPTLLIRDLLPQLRQNQGRVINVSSVLGFQGLPISSLYCASKFAIEGLTESLAYELAPHGVRCTLIQPGGFRTNFDQGAKWGERSLDPNSPYRRQIENYRAFRKKQSQSPLYRDPKEVIDGVSNLLKTDSNRLRHAFGTDALISKVARGLFPEQYYHSISKWFLLKIFNR